MRRLALYGLVLCALILMGACNKKKDGDSGSPTAPSAPCSRSVNPASVTFPATGGTRDVAVNQSGTCSPLSISSTASWIAATWTGSVRITVVGNPNPTIRSGQVLVDSGTSIAVSQEAQIPANCTYAVIFIPNANPGPFPRSGGNGAFSIGTQAGCPWGAVSTVPWITLTNATSGNGSFSGATFQVAANPGRDQRTGVIRVQQVELKVNQLGQ